MRQFTKTLTALALGWAALSAGAGALAAAPDSLTPDEAIADRPVESSALTQVADWVTATRDNKGAPFAVIDKSIATVFVFDGRGKLLGAAPALIGLAHGDDSVPGIGDRPLATILPEERTTPAGRFKASYGLDLHGAPVLWIDYATSISIHPVVTSNRLEQRQARLDSPSPDDNRITFGCVNVPADFYQAVVRPAFIEGNGLFYILPEQKPLEAVFPGFRGQARPAALRADGSAG